MNNRCIEAAWLPADSSSNPMVQQALEDFNTTVDNDPRMRDGLAAWQECMEQAGHPFADREDMMAAVMVDENYELQDQFWESEAWDPASEDHARWLELVELEIQIAVAEAGCSPALDEVRLAVVEDLRPQFAQVWQTIDWSLPPVTYPELMPIDAPAEDAQGPGTTDATAAVVDPEEGESTASTDSS